MANILNNKIGLPRDALAAKYLVPIRAAVLVGLALVSIPPAVAQQQQPPQQKQCDAVGRTPRNGDILQRHGTGPHRVVIENGGGAEAVVKMRDERRRTALMVYVGPYGTAQVDHFPSGRFRPEFATGRQWSPACGVFLFGMQVQRFPDFNDFQSHKAGEGRITITRARYIITPTEDGNVSPETDTIENFTAN
jgi:hypothetical protein